MGELNSVALDPDDALGLGFGKEPHDILGIGTGGARQQFDRRPRKTRRREQCVVDVAVQVADPGPYHVGKRAQPNNRACDGASSITWASSRA